MQQRDELCEVRQAAKRMAKEREWPMCTDGQGARTAKVRRRPRRQKAGARKADSVRPAKDAKGRCTND
ncbi:hypothetical protein Nepgr_008243 [Nepenthes gracilis]|uniref:Uncharacterized protein n=1 Tax=Nepenthes gracilis TaxID=150966 RepID=A0AAD3XJ28_NEPGR|nr:hypothetical protein Nepgr_008243 [Nepenthes gracilis]